MRKRPKPCQRRFSWAERAAEAGATVRAEKEGGEAADDGDTAYL